MKFYSLLVAMSLMAGFSTPTPAISPSNPSQTVAATEHSNPPPEPHRGQGRRELNG